MTAKPDLGDAGFALAIVLTFLLLAGTVATPFFITARQYAFIARNASLATKETVLSEAVLQLAGQRYMERAIRSDELPRHVSCGGSGRYPDIDFHFQNHAGLIDLNAASPELLQIGFTVLGTDAMSAQRLAADVENYRSVNVSGLPDTDTNVEGGFKHGLFEVPSELLDFRLPTAPTSDLLSQIFTVYSRSGTVDQDAAPPILLSALRQQPRGQLPFAISGSGRVPATTAEIRLEKTDNIEIRAFAVYVMTDVTGMVRRSGPVSVSRNLKGSVAIDAASDMDCETFFDSETLTILAELFQ